MMVPTNATTLEVCNLCTHFFTREGVLPAVGDVLSSLVRGCIPGLVGESGPGKSVIGFSIMGPVDPSDRVVGGEILYQGRGLTEFASCKLCKLQGNCIAMVFQDPMMTSNPVLHIDTQMIETVRAHGNASRKRAWDHARDTLGLMDISNLEKQLQAYPHQLSGRMRQYMVATIVTLHRPDLIIVDEPTTVLGMIIQAQTLSEMQEFMRMHGTTLVWIMYDLSVVTGLADEVVVMYAGRIVEHGPVNAVLDTPLHPYAIGLIDSLPGENRRGQCLRQISGVTPNLLLLPADCVFTTRCLRATEVYGVAPETTQPLPERLVRCFHPNA